MQKKYMYGTAENKLFLKSMTENLLDFGRKFPSPEGSSYYLGDDGSPWTERPRETWITCRMAHVYSIGKMLGYNGCGELAEAAVKGISGELQDRRNGGWYPGINSDGRIIAGKQCYAHAFVILAATSALLAGISGADALLKDAASVYDRFFWDEDKGLACDTWNTDFTVKDSYRGLNANMHTVEAFLALADALDMLNRSIEADDSSECSRANSSCLETDGEIYRKRAGRIIEHVVGWAENNNWRIPEHFTSDWIADLQCNADKKDDPFKPYGATPGHGIEWARLITQWALSSYSKHQIASTTKEQYIDAAEKLFSRAIADAWNSDGAQGIVYTTDWEGKPVVHDRMHWTLAEAINTSAVLYQVTGKQEMSDRYSDFMEYLDEKVLDHKNGSWFHQLDAENKLMDTVWPGKSDLYHAFQAGLIPYGSINLSIASDIYHSRKEN